MAQPVRKSLEYARELHSDMLRALDTWDPLGERILMTIRTCFLALPILALCLFVPANAQEAPEPKPVASASEAPSYGRELRSVEEEVNNLKERVFRSKATLALLKELVVEGATAGSKVMIWHMNDLGKAYSMESVQYFLDGKNVFTKVDPGGELAAVKEMKVHEQAVPAGTHNLQVKMTLRGAGYGVFSYLKSYQFRVQSSFSFEIDDARVKVIRVIAGSRGGTKNFVDRPVVRYEERADNLRKD